MKNRIYLGEIVHKGDFYPGEHEAIIDLDLWAHVQEAIAIRGSGPSRRQARSPSMLAGLLVDPDGEPMSPTQAKKGSRRYLYYATRPDRLEGRSAWRVPAPDLETLVLDQIATVLIDQQRLHDLVSTSGGDLAVVQRAIRAGEVVGAHLRDGTATDRRELIRSLVRRVALSQDGVSIELSSQGLLTSLGLDLSSPDAPMHLVCDAARVRQGHEIRLVIPSATTAAPNPPSGDAKLIALLAEAHVARKLVLANPDHSLSSLAAREGRCRTRLKQLLEISYLAPSITTAIVDGRHPAELNHRKLLQVDLPIDWAQQRAALGFA